MEMARNEKVRVDHIAARGLEMEEKDCRKHRKIDSAEELEMMAPEPEEFARFYQLEALNKAKKENTIVFLETGSGKTLIAIMLLRSYAHQLRKPSEMVAVFLVPAVVLVKQQAEAIERHTDLKVRKLWGDMGTDFWSAKNWEDELREYEVFVMTPAILLRNLQHRFFKLEMIKLLIFDECHRAKGNSPYACIMKEFYHKELLTNGTQLPRILGMTASPINSKGLNSKDSYAIYIRQLEILMNSKVYTVANELVLAEFIPFSTPKVIMYKDMPLHDVSFLVEQLRLLETKHLQKLEKLHLDEGAIEGAKKRVTKLHAAFHYCLTELGIWLTMKAAESLICSEADIFFWEQRKDVLAEKSARNFSQDVFQAFSQIVASGWCIGEDFKADLERGLMTAKVNCLIQSLMTYRDHADLRCIVFVERVITAIVIQALLSSVPQLRCWKTMYMAGNQSRLQCQSRGEQMKIVDAFREGTVNLIVATQILEEGLDVQNCNLVIRFDLSTNVCSFIQSRGRARMQHSDYLLLVKSGDSTAFSKIQKYLSSGDIMREESLRQASVPCPLPEGDMNEEDFYCVETTGARVTLSSSMSLIYFYCSKLPSDRYFKPLPRFAIDQELEMCTLYLPKSCPISAVKVQGPSKILKKRACLEACRQLHRIGALTNYLLPELEVDEVADAQNIGGKFFDEQDYFPAELVDCWSSFSEQQIYHCYLFCLKQNFDYDIRVGDIFFVVKCQLDDEVMQTEFQLETDRGSVTVSMKHIGTLHLSRDEVMLARRFQITILRLLVDHDLSKLNAALQHEDREGTLAKTNYLLLPSTGCSEGVPNIDWECLKSVSFVSGIDSSNCLIRRKYGGSPCSCPGGVAQLVHTYNNVVCRCMLKNSVVLTPHNGFIYSIDDFLYNMDGNSLMKGKQNLTYKEYFQSSHGRLLCHETEPLLGGRHIFLVKNFLHKSSVRKNKESRSSTCELPPELCMIILSPISAITLYSFSFVPSIMHRIKGILLAVALKRMQMNHYTQNALVPATKVLEALTTKKCQEAFSLESLEALGDSFLKYAACQQLFRDHKHHHEGLLSAKKDKIVSNYALFKLGCDQRLPGFIQHEYFDPKEWVIPGNTLDFMENDKEVVLSNTTKLYSRGTRQMKIKVVADVVEALLGAYLSTGGEPAALMFMDWLGMKISFVNEVPDELPFLAKPEMYINIQQIESLVNYSFRNTSLLVEAFTHGSYQVSELQGCYQRLEFLGDSVLDYLITKHLYNTYPGLSPGLLTDLRSASVNNEYYAVAAAKAKLNKHILYASSVLHKQITLFVNSVEQLTSDCFYGWESDTTLPKALGDIIESLAGAILVDSGFDKEIVWKCIRPLLGRLVTPSTIKYHPVRELEELCRRNTYELNFLRTCENGFAAVTAEVRADGSVYSKTCSGENKKAAKKLAAKALLELLRASYLNL